jgi:hypothetical protein
MASQLQQNYLAREVEAAAQPHRKVVVPLRVILEDCSSARGND